MKHPKTFKILVAGTVLASSLSFTLRARADVQLSPLFSDKMILQRGVPVPIWGTADAGERVSVTLGQTTQTALAGPDGKWMVRLPALPANSGLEMTVSGKNTLKVSDVAIGEVWLASGQSNMELRVPRVTNAATEIANAKFPLVRQFRVGRSIATSPQRELKGNWENAVPETIEGFSAVGYFFARELHQKLGVPVGIIHASYGGTPAESWTSQPTLQSSPALASVNQDWEKVLAASPTEQEKHERQLEAWKERVAKAKAEGKREPTRPATPRGPGDKSTPSGLYNGMIAPVAPYGIKGVIWYQGESNTRDAELYRTLFPSMIQGWRRDWNSELPFLWVQLAGFHKTQTAPVEDGWASLREVQTQTLSLPNTGMATAIDVGEANDIHPRNKQEVGRRLALVALAKQYGQTVEFSGPQFTSMKAEGAALRLNFTHAQGLKAKDGVLKGFALSGKDGQWAWADARIDGQSVVLSSTNVPAPVAARYGWADNPIGNLVNAAELPAVPFRTDSDQPAELTPVNAPVVPVPVPVAALVDAAAPTDGAEAPADQVVTNAPTRSVVYKTTKNAAGEAVELAMEIFEPQGHKNGDKKPAIVLFYGGGWSDGATKNFWAHAAYFASRGMVAITPDYRVKNRQKTTAFESVADAKSALRYVRQNAAKLGIDPNRIVAAGSSAGGHLAASTAIVPGLDEPNEDLKISSIPNALVLYNPVIDTSVAGYGNARLGARWQQISPRHHVRAGLPPTITFHGTADKTVPYANAVAFDEAMKAAGNRSELVTLRGTGHGFAYQIQKKAANRAARETDVFLNSLGYLQGEPTLLPATQ